ncbi:hypothetical protein ACFC8N_02230 [Streptomyces sp. NPDC055966]|uniref:hypothetical protein n=1 Tax=Streptomyces sp. NPDC055966 TaxID=3345669 RepID=UPI0035DD88B1
MRATGHGLPGGYEGGLLVTTGRMDGLTVDAEARTVRVQAGCAGGRWSRRSRCRPGPPRAVARLRLRGGRPGRGPVRPRYAKEARPGQGDVRPGRASSAGTTGSSACRNYGV